MEMSKEFNLAKDLVHPNIVQYKHFIRKRGKADEEEEFHIVMEYMRGGDLK